MLIDRLAAEEPPIKPGSFTAYALATTFATLALLVRLVVGEVISGSPFLTFIPAVIASALLGGFGPGMLATILSALLAWYFLVPTYWSFAFDKRGDASALALFVVIGTLGCIVIQGFLAAITKLRAERRHIAELNASLEERVALRTRDLSQLNDRLAATNSMLEAEQAARAQAEEIVRHAQKMEALGQLTSGVAHDFNNLLTIIQGNLELARQGVTGDSRLLLDSAMHGTDRAAALTQGLLAFSRSQPLKPRTVDCNQLIARLSDVIGQTLGPGIAVERIDAPDLWKCVCDPSQLEASLLNLIVNARDAMPGGGKLTIEAANVELDDSYASTNLEVTPGRYVMLAVSDTGQGMTDEVRSRAFDPFFTTKPSGQGTGLGLSMVFGFIKQSGGHVKIYSEPGFGTTVRLYLPRQVGAEADEPVISTESSSPASGVVLLVEDDAEVRAFTVKALQRLGYSVIEATDAHAALAMIREGCAFDILVTDVSMPEMDGRLLAREVEKLKPGVPVLYVTGYTRNAIVHQGRLDPDVVMLAKPFRIAQLGAKLREAIAAARERDDRRAAG